MAFYLQCCRQYLYLFSWNPNYYIMEANLIIFKKSLDTPTYSWVCLVLFGLFSTLWSDTKDIKTIK